MTMLQSVGKSLVRKTDLRNINPQVLIRSLIQLNAKNKILFS